ncbi:GH32 C-terminal domain-containing protein [Liquorilactobacillus hordei]|uniref:GH32 C-terminal domain-containing protein n=1 Tax=Liquorilactobacillus hordei TaxID=468911 RepID=UPI0039EBEADE
MNRRSNEKEHYKMYKQGKNWVFSIVFISGGLLFSNYQVSVVKGDTVSATALSKSSQASSDDTSNAASTSSSTTATSDTSNAASTSSSTTATSDTSNAASTSSSTTATSDTSNAVSTSSSTTATSDTSDAASTSSSKAATSDTSNAVSTSSSATATSDTSDAASTSSSATATSDTSNAVSTSSSTTATSDTTSDATTVSNSIVTTSSSSVTNDVVANEQYDEEYRNQFHYSPSENWMNDPNGLFYDSTTGLYNLYYQYNPDGNEWGNMSWGHAVSKDMINWTQEDVAIPVLTNQSWEDFTYTNTTGNLAQYGEVRYVGTPTTNWGDANGEKDIFSGSIVVDTENVSGLGKGAILAFYTADYQIATRVNDGQDGGWGTWIGLTEIQEQHLAYSLDGGKTFIQYSSDGNSANPQAIIPITASKGGDSANFRDPNVVYDAQNKQYLMTVVSGQEALVYKSKNLLNWEYASTIQRQNDVGDGVWECPALIPMTVAGTNETKWIFSVSVQQGAHATGSGMQYYVGTVDANGNWTPESSTTMANPMTFDSGEDFYAGITFANMSNNRTVMLGWESNWTYTGEAKTTPWYGNMTLPRELTLVKDSNSTDGYLLKNNVVSEIKNNENANVISSDDASATLNNEEKKLSSENTTYKVSATFSWNTENPPKTVGFKLRISDDGKYYMTVGYDLTTHLFFVQRLNTGEANMGDPRDKMNAYVDTSNGTITLTVYVDETSIEAFANDGEKSITQNFFMRPENIGNQSTTGIALFSEGGSVNVENLSLNPIESIWNNSARVDVKYVDANGNNLLDSKQYTGKIGDNYNITPPAIDGYYLAKTETENKNDNNVYTAQDQSIVYVYAKVQTALNVKDSTITAGSKTGWSAADNFVSATDTKGNQIDLKDITVSGSVDTTKAGSYKVTYSYTDSQGNTISKTITVTVIAENSQKPDGNEGNSGSNNSNLDNNSGVNDSSNKFDNLSFDNKKVEGTKIVNNKFKSAQSSKIKGLRSDTTRNKSQNELPQTGEKNESRVTIWGLLLAILGSIGAMVGIKKSRN